jgi:hypothetical protein
VRVLNLPPRPAIATDSGPSFQCDHCEGTIGGTRLICLICQSKYTWNTVDLCDTPECVATTVGKAGRPDLPRPHLPTHDLVKVRRVVHSRQFGTMYRESKAALQKSRAIFERGTMAPNSGRAVKGVDTAKKRISTAVTSAPPTPRCIVCDEPVLQPCWYCVNCKGPYSSSPLTLKLHPYLGHAQRTRLFA